MRKIFWTAAAAAVFVAVPAMAQDGDAVESSGNTRAIQPYVGILGGYERFDNEATHSGIPMPASGSYKGGLVEGVVGVNVPVGPLFVGAEGSVAKGFTGDIDWEYGAAGRFGVRSGDSGLFYGKVGYRWVNFDALGKNSGDYGEMVYGVGTEFAPAAMSGGKSNVRVRLEVDTYGNAHSFRPMAGLIAAF
ncbi:opacity protein [Hephaestia sp. GCM10023244]|uniref:opacity protein n=1 Tax=unclassified Hephaestia TaxID=2631281 RepID=UPI002076F42D|nr:opacity protein [Hephaestia sp. MAHUQ-44]MCM8729499.1 opacity protein [Hephaestia sp. MAHUQ-44]